MKIRYYFVIGLVVLAGLAWMVHAGIGQERHGLTFATSTGGDRLGVAIYVKTNFTLLNVTKDSRTTANLSSVYNGSGALLAVSPFVNNVANFTLNFVAGQNYTIEGNQTSESVGINTCNSVSTTRPVNGSVLDWTNGTFDGVVGGNTGTFCTIESITYSIADIVGATANIYNTTTVETARESFVSNFTLPAGSVSSANLIYNTVPYSATVANPSGTSYVFSGTADVPTGSNPGIWFWNITFTNGSTSPSTTYTQGKGLINMSLCQAAPQNVVFLNFTFRNETTAQEQVNASIPASSWVYWDATGTGVYNKSFTYATSTENKFYAFCYTPAYRTVESVFSLSYDNTESEQRTYAPEAQSFTNVTTNVLLYLLPSNQGSFVTFQVINLAQQSLEGVEITAARSGIGTIETKTTDASGSATMFLNPNFAYTLTFTKAGFDTYTTTLSPTQSTYTITLSSSSGSNATDPQRGMTFTVRPPAGTLNNNTVYNFNLTINSTFWDLDSWGFTLRNASGSVFVSNTSTSPNGGLLTASLNTGANKTIVMNYFWVIEGVYNNASVIWGVIDLSDTGFSWFQFFSDTKTYASAGFFGLDDFGLALITFLAIFVFTGIMSYKFGISSPAAIMALVFGLVLFFDVGIGMIPYPPAAFPHFITIVVGILFIGAIIREVSR